MLSKCANPKCPAVFRYLHEGKLFEFDERAFEGSSFEVPGPKRYKKPSQEIECFWLCASCALTLRLVREPRTDKVVIVPRHNGIERGRDVGDTAIANLVDDLSRSATASRRVPPCKRQRRNVCCTCL